MRSGTSHRRIVIACIAIGASLSATAQSPPAAWRCGNTYTDQPCPGGRAVAADDPPSAARVRDADGHTRQLQTEAQRMERERLLSEKAHARQAGLVHIPRPTTSPTAQEPAPAKVQKKTGRKEPPFFTAAGPGGTAAKKKAKAEKANAGD